MNGGGLASKAEFELAISTSRKLIRWTFGGGQKALVSGLRTTYWTTTDCDGYVPGVQNAGIFCLAEAEWLALRSMEVSVKTAEQRRTSDKRGHPADRRLFVAAPDAWDAMTAPRAGQSSPWCSAFANQ